MTTQINQQAIKKAESNMWQTGLKETIFNIKVPTKTRFFAAAVYIRNGFESLCEFSFDYNGNVKSVKEIYKNRYVG